MSVRIVTAVAAVLAALTPPAAWGVDLMAHRAFYEMSLASATQGSGIVSGGGAMTYRFARECDGWTVENRTRLQLIYEGGQQLATEWVYVTWESEDGRKFRFRARHDRNGETIEELRGDADLTGEGGGTARFTMPDARTEDLPTGTLFPVRHIHMLLEAATAGETRLSRVVFDGSSGDNPYLVTALFGPLAAGDTQSLADRAGLPHAPSWWTQAAFFAHNALEPEPVFEIAAQYRADGVADHIVQDFGEFALRVELSAVEPLPPPDC